MRYVCFAVFTGILLGMVFVTARASLVRPVWDNSHLMADPWFQATLADAYCGFLTFFAWVAYRERARTARMGWFVAIMLLGNIAMAAYVLLQLLRLKRDQPLAALFGPKPRS